MSKRYAAPLILSAVLLSACGGGGDDGGGGSAAVDPALPNDVANAVLLKIGATTATSSTAALPTPSSDPAAPVASADSAAAKVDDTTGSATSVTLSFEANSVIATIFAKISGSSTLFTITSPPAGKASAKTTQAFTVDLQLLSQFGTGQFCVDFSGQDANGLVSNAETVCVVAAPPNCLQGTYFDATHTSDGTLTFFSDGTYVLATRNSDPNCGSVTAGAQLEVGTYTWNAGTHSFTVGTPSLDNNGDCGLNSPGSHTLTKNADGSLTLTVQDSHGSNSFVFNPVPSEPGTVIGSFQPGTSGTARSSTALPIVTFFDSTHYALIVPDTDPQSTPGIELGCYSIDPSTDEFAVDVAPTSQTCTTLSGQAPFDSNAEGGFSDSFQPSTLKVTGGNTLEFHEATQAPVTITRIPAARSPRPGPVAGP